MKRRGSEWDKPAELTASRAEQSEEDLFTLAVPQAHADNSKAPGWQDRHQHYSPVSQLPVFIQSKERLLFIYFKVFFADLNNITCIYLCLNADLKIIQGDQQIEACLSFYFIIQYNYLIYKTLSYGVHL